MPKKKSPSVSVPSAILKAIKTDFKRPTRPKYQPKTKKLVCDWIRAGGLSNKQALDALKAQASINLAAGTLSKWTQEAGINIRGPKSASGPKSSSGNREIDRLRQELAEAKSKLARVQLQSEASAAKKSLRDYVWSKISGDDSEELTSILITYYHSKSA